MFARTRRRVPIAASKLRRRFRRDRNCLHVWITIRWRTLNYYAPRPVTCVRIFRPDVSDVEFRRDADCNIITIRLRAKIKTSNSCPVETIGLGFDRETRVVLEGISVLNYNFSNRHSRWVRSRRAGWADETFPVIIVFVLYAHVTHLK